MSRDTADQSFHPTARALINPTTQLPPQIERIDTLDGVQFILSRPPYHRPQLTALATPALYLAVMTFLAWLALPELIGKPLIIKHLLIAVVIVVIAATGLYHIYSIVIYTLGHIEIQIDESHLRVFMRLGPLRKRVSAQSLCVLTRLTITRRTKQALKSLLPVGESSVPEPAALQAAGPDSDPIMIADGYPAAWLIPLAGAIIKIKPELSLTYNYLDALNTLAAEDVGPIEPDALPILPALPDNTEIILADNGDKLSFTIPKPRLAVSDVMVMSLGVLAMGFFLFLAYQLSGKAVYGIEEYILMPVTCVIAICAFCLAIVLPIRRLTTSTEFVLDTGPTDPTLSVIRQGLSGKATETIMPASLIRSISIDNTGLRFGDHRIMVLVIKQSTDKPLQFLMGRKAADIQWVAVVLGRALNIPPDN